LIAGSPHIFPLITVHTHNVLRQKVLRPNVQGQNVLETKHPEGQNILETKRPEGQNVLRDKMSRGTKCPAGQNVFRDKTSCEKSPSIIFIRLTSYT
jgi:hypothetical protein